MVQQADHAGPVGYVFAVADRPYCCWDLDHNARTLEFLEGIDPDYFGTLAALYAAQLEDEDAMAASIALRVSYHQGLEALMSLLGAAAQAPLAVPAWIAKCATGDLRTVVASLRDGRPLLGHAEGYGASFTELSESVHRFAWTDESAEDSTAARFGRFWRRLAKEFLDETAQAEYNALKHGNRVVAGGFSLSIGVEETPRVPAPPEAMQPMGGSRFGATFFVAERAGTSKEHIRTRRTSVNWSPQGLAQRLNLMSMSINNIVGALRCDLGVDAASIRFERPSPLSAFDEVWMNEPGVRSSGLDTVVRIDRQDERSREELIELLQGGRRADPP